MSSLTPNHNRILLVDFVIIDRFHCGIEFPYLQGFCKNNRIPCQTVTLGMEAAGAKNDFDDEGTHLSRKDRNNLLKSIHAFCPVFIIFSRAPSNKTYRDIVGSSTPSAVTWLYLNGEELVELRNGRSISTPDYLAMLVPDPVQTDTLYEAAADFSSTAINEKAAGHRPLPHLLCGSECGYNKALSSNPLYKDVDLSNTIRRSGCSFCYTHSSTLQQSTPKILQAFQNHLRNGFATVDWHGHRPRFRVLGYAMLLHFDGFIKTISDPNIPAADYLFNCRADEIVRLYPGIREGLRKVQHTENKVYFALIGVENFVQEELNRFNKGISTNTLLEMFVLLFQLEKEFPDNFNFREYGGFSTILFTPWTTLNDFEFNIRIIDLIGAENLFGKLFTSRLRLYKSLPIYKLAEKAGVLSHEYEDKVLNTAHWNYYDKESPWKFLDKRVEILNRILARIPRNNAFADDPLYHTVQSWYGRISTDSNNTVQTALTLITVLREHDRLHIPAILALAEKLIDRTKRSIDFQKQFTDEIDIDLDLFGFTKQYRKVGKIDCVAADDISTAQQFITSKIKSALHSSTLQLPRHPDFYEFFYGPSSEDVKSAVSGADRINRATASTEINEAIISVGTLLGYPPCCATAFSKATLFEKTSNEWLHVKRRAFCDHEISPYNNPFLGYCSKYVPCSYNCAESHKRNREFLDFFKQRQSIESSEQFLGEDPVFFLLDVPGNSIVLKEPVLSERTIADSKISEYELCYSPAPLGAVTDDRMHHLLQGNRLLIRPGIIDVYNNDRKINTFILTAFIWWHAHCFHQDFWRNCSILAENKTDVSDERAQETVPGGSTKINNVLHRIAPLVQRKTGYTLREVQPASKSIRICYQENYKMIEFIISAADGAHDGLFKGERICLSHSKKTPMQDRRDIILARILFYALEKTDVIWSSNSGDRNSVKHDNTVKEYTVDKQ